MFFASAGQFVSSFNYLDVPKNVKIDLKGRPLLGPDRR